MLQQGINALPMRLFTGNTDAQGVDLDQASADVCAWVVPCKCEIIEVGGAVTETCAGASTTPEFDFDLRPTSGSDTGRGTGDIGHLVMSTTAAGKVMYDKAARGQVLYPGQEIVGKVKTRATGTGAAGHIHPYVLVKPLDDVKANLSNMVQTA